MRKPIFPLIKTGFHDKPPLFWFIFHCVLFLALGVSMFILGPVRINTNLMDIIPVSGELKSAVKADAIIGGRNSRQIVILSASEDFSMARAGAEELYTVLSQEHDAFEFLTLWIDETFMDRFRQYLYDYRFMLLDAETIELLENDYAPVIATDALASVFSPLTFAPFDDLSGDPFLLVEKSMQKLLGSSLLSSGNMSPYDDVLAAQYEGVWYVMLRGSLEPKGLGLTNRKSTVKKIYDAGAQITAANHEFRFFYSGVPFHSYESSSNAQREISIISTISLIVILAIFLYVFRFPVPALASFAAIGLSLLSAFASAMLFFREVHVLGFVFGTTLIGTCVDYSIHFFIHRNALISSAGKTEQVRLFSLKANVSGFEARRSIFRGICLCLLSTIICFTSLLFAPFAILKQFAVFSITGLLSSFLTVMCIFPHIRTEKRKGSFPVFHLLQKFRPVVVKMVCVILLSVSFILFLIILFVNREQIKVENKLGDLYRMNADLLESESINAQVLNYGTSGWYFIVSGADTEEVLQNEEELRAALDAEIHKGNLGSYMAVSLFCPSQRNQRASFMAAEKLTPLAQGQFEVLGFPPGTAEAYRKEFSTAERYLLPTDNSLPPELGANLWIGKSDDKYYSCVLPFHATGDDIFRQIASERENIFLVNKIKDTEQELDRLSRTMLFLFLIAFIVIIIMVRRFFSWRQTIRIAVIPVYLILTVLTTLSCLNIPLGFFTIVGLVLVFGLGLDFIFYNCEAENRKQNREHTALAIFLSFATTVLSFGALALSSFAPVHIFGITVFSGLCAAYIFSTLLSANVVSENQRISGHGSASPPEQ